MLLWQSFCCKRLDEQMFLNYTKGIYFNRINKFNKKQEAGNGSRYDEETIYQDQRSEC